MSTMNSRQRGRQPPPAPRNIDLTSRQRLAVQQIQEDSIELDRLEQRKEQLLARINANRGKLELIAELAKEYGTEQPIVLPGQTESEE